MKIQRFFKTAVFLSLCTWFSTAQGQDIHDEIEGGTFGNNRDIFVVNSDESFSDAGIRLQTRAGDNGGVYNDWNIYADRQDRRLRFSYWTSLFLPNNSDRSDNNENDIGFVGMVLTHDGMLGVRLQDPTAELDVGGDGKIRGNLDVSLDLSVNGDLILSDDRDIYGADLITGFNDLRFRASPTSGINMSIETNGNIGIGNTSPEERLHVAGNIKATEALLANSATIDGTVTADKVVLNIGSFPDYVFADDYKLMPLEEVAAYIKANKHLPNVPSESEVVAQGMSVGQINTILMEKVEELTLHTINQEEKIDRQEEYIDLLMKELAALKAHVFAAEKE